MRALVFDSSAVISIITNNLLSILTELKKYYHGEFYITNKVKEEIVDAPLRSRRFRLEALQLAHYIADKYIKIYERNVEEKTNYLLTLANTIFIAKDNYISILQKGEVETLALAALIEAQAIVIDERTTRLLIEDPLKLKKLLENKLHTKVKLDKHNLNYFKKETKDIKVIRSSELMIMAFELGLFKEYEHSKLLIKDNFKRYLLEGILWGLRLKGCAISTEEINEALKIENIR